MLQVVVDDKKLLEFMKEGLNQEVCTNSLREQSDKQHFRNSSGLPQGNPLSPLLSNFYLKDFDSELVNQGFSPVRYADDLVIMCINENDTKKALEWTKTSLKDFNLRIHDVGEKTNCFQITKDSPIEFLSIEFNGLYTLPTQSKVDDFLYLINEVSLNTREYHSVNDYLRTVSNRLDGWISNYAFTDKVNKYFPKMDWLINYYLHMGLTKRRWRLKGDNLPSGYRRKNSSFKCLTKEQRKHSGIEFCSEILGKKKSNNKT